MESNENSNPESDPFDTDLSEAIKNANTRVTTNINSFGNQFPNPAVMFAKDDKTKKYLYINAFSDIQSCKDKLKTYQSQNQITDPNNIVTQIISYRVNTKELLSDGNFKKNSDKQINCSIDFCFCIQLSNPKFNENLNNSGDYDSDPGISQ